MIATNLRTGKIDGAVLWEPSVSRIGDIVGEGVARIVATGYTFGISDAGAIAMREDFMKRGPISSKRGSRRSWKRSST